jgi:hypothetical protein
LEFIVVVCKRSEDAPDDPVTNVLREVVIDGDDESGATQTLLGVDAGPHDVDLGEPLNYGPPTLHVMLMGGSTSQFTPRRLLFWLV